MKKMRYSLAAGIIAAIVLAAAGCSGSEAESASETTQQETAQQTTAQASETEAAEAVKEEAEAEYIFKYTHASPAQGFQQDGAIHLGEMLKEYSGGRIIQETYPAGQLAEKQASLEGLQFGTIEITALSLSDLSQFDNIWDVFALPYLFDSADQAVKIMSDPQIKEITDASAGDAGFRVLAWVNVGERNIMNSKHAINTPEDMQGIKIRVMQSPALVDAMEALGASPITLAWTECYTGMQQGTIDAVENSAPVLSSNGFQEVAKYYSKTAHFIMPDVVLMSKSVYEGLPEDLQEAVDQAGQANEDFWNDELYPGVAENELQPLEEAGVEITTPDLAPFKEIADKENAETIKNFDDRQMELYNAILEVKDQYK